MLKKQPLKAAKLGTPLLAPGSAAIEPWFERGSQEESGGCRRSGADRPCPKLARGKELADGPKNLFLHEIESALELQFKLRAFGQAHFVSAACFHQVGFQRCNRRVLGGFLRIFVLDTANRALACSFGCSHTGRLLGAGLAFK